MIKLLVLCLVISLSCLCGHHESTKEYRGAVEAKSEAEFNLRIFKSISSKLKFLGELSIREEEISSFKSLRVGAYYRLMRNLKFGLFYSVKTGLLHDDDWTKEEEAGTKLWGWEHTEDRAEHIFTGDMTYRSLLKNNFIFELKSRYSYNSFNTHQFLRFRPGVNYLYKKNGLAFMNFFVQHETYHPLSGYSKESVYEKWIYLGVMYHWSQMYKVGGFVANRENYWESGLVSSKVLGLNFLVVL